MMLMDFMLSRSTSSMLLTRQGPALLLKATSAAAQEWFVTASNVETEPLRGRSTCREITPSACWYKPITGAALNCESPACPWELSYPSDLLRLLRDVMMTKRNSDRSLS